MLQERHISQLTLFRCAPTCRAGRQVGLGAQQVTTCKPTVPPIIKEPVGQVASNLAPVTDSQICSCPLSFPQILTSTDRRPISGPRRIFHSNREGQTHARFWVREASLKMQSFRRCPWVGALWSFSHACR
jgi:hypothetical protein